MVREKRNYNVWRINLNARPRSHREEKFREKNKIERTTVPTSGDQPGERKEKDEGRISWGGVGKLSRMLFYINGS